MNRPLPLLRNVLMVTCLLLLTGCLSTSSRMSQSSPEHVITSLTALNVKGDVSGTLRLYDFPVTAVLETHTQTLSEADMNWWLRQSQQALKILSQQATTRVLWQGETQAVLRADLHTVSQSSTGIQIDEVDTVDYTLVKTGSNWRIKSLKLINVRVNSTSEATIPVASAR